MIVGLLRVVGYVLAFGLRITGALVIGVGRVLAAAGRGLVRVLARKDRRTVARHGGRVTSGQRRRSNGTRPRYA